MTLEEQLFNELTQDEGVRPYLYNDLTGKRLEILPGGGKATIGIGRNLSDVPLSEKIIKQIFLEDVERATADAIELVPGLKKLSQNRQAAIINLSFNLGYVRLKRFKDTLSAINSGNWTAAAQGLQNSLWAKQVQKSRSTRIIKQVREG